MLRYLLAVIFFIFVSTAANAQTHADSVANHTLVDSVIKHQPTDTVVKHVPIDSVVKHSPIDSVAKHLAVDSVMKHPAVDSLAKHLAVDSVMKHPSVDSVAKHLADSVMKHQPVDRVVKNPPVKGAIKHPANDIVIKHSPVKTLSDERYNAYLTGYDLDNMALAGELNHFPLPDQVLKFKKQLDLSPIQVGQLTKLAAALYRKKLEMGEFIINNEKMLDNMFHARHLDEGSIIFYTNRSGLYYGELKGAILMACYNTEKLLTDAQIKKLEVLEKIN